MSKNVLIAFECSQVVCKAFRERGFNAYSLDIQPCYGGMPEWHIQTDAFNEINKPFWDLVIMHPPCTFLTCAANKYYNVDVYGEKALRRIEERKEAVKLFLRCTECSAQKWAIENRVGVMSTLYRKPDCVINPYQFGEPERKRTCLWLRGLPPLRATKVVEPVVIRFGSGKTDSPLHYKTMFMPEEERQRIRSQTFAGIGKAIAEQWGAVI